MSTFALIHGAGDGGWAWHLVEEVAGAPAATPTVAPDLPTDESATLTDYADVVLDAIGPPEEHVVVVGHSVRRIHRSTRRRSASGRRLGVRRRDDPEARRGTGRLVGEHRLRRGGT